MQLRIKKATHILQREFPWIDREDVETIVDDLEKSMIEDLGQDFIPMQSQDIIDTLWQICEDA